MSTVSRQMVEETVTNDQSRVSVHAEMADFEYFLDKKIEIEDDLFQSFRCFITGFSPRHTKIISDQIRNGGGYIFDQITPSITHIICSTKNAAVI